MIKQKFIVIKREDADKYLPNHDKIDLRHILRQINEGRAKEGKKDNEYLVVNKDEPYAGLVENLILNKVTDDNILEEIKEKILKE
ncbi:hypothetical protein [Clostridium beijerinckii]|uniref:hypothetical protein n=1 Tax=Clostridium beijerinckii TaxID=1520 RepID=UPI00136199DA|nr:hypothetical protein [Clostridium beijerinckii]MZK53472.1 hypothetical protein [Clostridium beijerinckii]MZK61610.1 hypothetical protein [Clostridium beijerinckii]MZK71835.1 hypothetical protein [Clostridium beijerinckii]MZK77239.1 hypothetical protein [Clostridium beijerinckii]MZK86318.1 hypothetical protein [Clostridium beijerinckii]